MFKRVGEIEFADTIEKEEAVCILSMIEKEGYVMCLDDSYNSPRYIVMKEEKV